MNNAQREFFEAYDNWCLAGCPSPDNLNQTLLIAIGYVLNCTDGRPDENERALLRALFDAAQVERAPQ